MTRHRAYIGVGSNMGDKLENCKRAIAALASPEGQTMLKAQSPFYRTEPMYIADQEWFVNAVVLFETVLEPEDLLDVLQGIQRRAGRQNEGVRFGPRPLDLDILFYDDRVIRTGRLDIPHPRLHERRFVLQPLCDISPDMVHPVLKKDIKTLLNSLGDAPGQMVMRL